MTAEGNNPDNIGDPNDPAGYEYLTFDEVMELPPPKEHNDRQSRLATAAQVLKELHPIQRLHDIFS